MAYFPNGSAGAVLDNQCEECLYAFSDDILCPVQSVQMLYNYEQNKNEKLEECLNHLVDENGICQMKRVLDACKILKVSSTDDLSELEAWERSRH